MVFAASVLISTNEESRFDYDAANKCHVEEIGLLFPYTEINQAMTEDSERWVKPFVTRPDNCTALWGQDIRDPATEISGMVVTFGKITYTDVFKVHHWITFCNQWNGTDTDQTHNCRAYNQVDGRYE
jgi:hypothetical protein